jgi:hypothetical protein
MHDRSVLCLPFLLLAFSSCRPSPPSTPPPQPDLAWTGPKLYAPPSVIIPISGFGLSGQVDVLPPAPPAYPVVISRDFVNAGNAALSAGYQITETVVAMNFVSTGTTVGFVPSAAPPIASLTQLGPALAPGDTATAVFGFTVPGCGMYQETLTLDATGVAAESNEPNNMAVHHFVVPGNMNVTVTLAPNRPEHMWHANAGPAPGFVTVFPAFPAVTHTFTITPSPGTTYYFNYKTTPYTGFLGAVGQFVGPPPVQPPAAPVGGVTVIRFQVTPATHSVPATDILTDLGTENFVPKVTAITSDGCVVVQQSAKVMVSHP